MKKLAIALVPVLALALSACSTSTSDAPSNTILDLVGFYDDTATLEAAVGAADPSIPAALDASGELTLFAPTEEGFAAALEDLAAVCGVAEYTAADLLGVEQGVLDLVLSYHVVPAKVLSGDLAEGDVTMFAGGAVTVSLDDGVTLTDAVGRTVNVVATDREASNGVVHFIDNVLLPAAEPGILNCPTS